MDLTQERGQTVLQLGAGMFLRDTLVTGYSAQGIRNQLRQAIDDGRLLGATLPGAGFAALPDVHSLGDDRRCQVLKRWRVTMAGTLVGFSGEGLAALLGPGRVRRLGDVTIITAWRDLEEGEPLSALTWVGETDRGLMIIELNGVMSSGGLTLSFAQGERGIAPFRFQALSYEDEEEPLFRILLVNDAGDGG